MKKKIDLDKYYNPEDMMKNRIKPWSYDDPIPRIKGIPVVDRDWRLWLSDEWKSTPCGCMHCCGDYWNKEWEDQTNPPFWVFEFKDYKKINPILKKEIIYYSDLTAQNKTTNIKGGMTEWKHTLENDKFKPIHDFIDTIARKLAFEYHYKLDPMVKNNTFKVSQEDGWAATLRKGEFTQPHGHVDVLRDLDDGEVLIPPNTHWSWVYYVDVTDKCSPLVMTYSGEEIKPTNGSLVMFPPWVIHHVPEQKVNHPRMCMAGNLILKKKIKPVVSNG
tara:strand:+ start:219 stop:1040 length:822 start_codon:yes stop_codon:yes gene_type:complete